MWFFNCNYRVPSFRYLIESSNLRNYNVYFDFFFVSLILIFLFNRSRMDLRVGKIWLSQFSVLWERSRSMPWRTLAPSKRLFAWSRMQIAESCGKVDSSVAYWCPVSRWMSIISYKMTLTILLIVFYRQYFYSVWLLESWNMVVLGVQKLYPPTWLYIHFEAPFGCFKHAIYSFVVSPRISIFFGSADIVHSLTACILLNY